MKWLIDRVRDPSLSEMNVDTRERMNLHGGILSRKRMLREVFEEFHHLFDRLDRRYFSVAGQRIELGSGVAPVRASYPDVLASDVVSAPHLDLSLDAQDMNISVGTVRVFFGQNCFHHFPDPGRFFEELQRVLRPGAGVILLEPYFGPFASFLFRRLFKTEGFDKDLLSWVTPVSGPMNGANQALSYIVFFRDRDVFHAQYHGLRIVHHEICGNYIKYLLSGGLNFIQLAPGWMSPVIDWLQIVMTPMKRWLGLHHVVVIERVDAEAAQ